MAFVVIPMSSARTTLSPNALANSAVFIGNKKMQYANSIRYAPRDPPNYVLGGSENHAESTPPFPQATLQHGAGYSRNIEVQGFLTGFSQVLGWFAGPITTCSGRYTFRIG